jgi:hypothetical protein
MGTIYQAECPCGYKSDNLLEGFGMSGIEFGHKLALCKHCQEIVSINTTGPKKLCPKCRGKVKVINLAEEKRKAKFPDPIPFDCPKCKRKAMEFRIILFWD